MPIAKDAVWHGRSATGSDAGPPGRGTWDYAYDRKGVHDNEMCSGEYKVTSGVAKGKGICVIVK
jgi:hypothetical protein